MSASREMHHFSLLDANDQHNAVLRLHRSGLSDHSIAAATRWSVEAVRRLIVDASKHCEAAP